MKEVKIFDDENSIITDDNFSTIDFTFFPNDKRFKVRGSVKDDCFYNNDVIEYKITVNPIEIYVRTLESSHEPPLEYTIKDGVVLESEIKKGDNVFLKEQNRIDELKKEVEWNKISIFGHYQVNLYILYKHPELISKEDYRRFLRQSLERIKAGVSKVEDYIKTDSKGLKIHINKDDNNPWLWYENDDLDKKQRAEYLKLSGENLSESEYGEKSKNVEKISKMLFTEGSKEYVGISEFEFRISYELIKYIEGLLDNKNTILVSKENISNGNELISKNKVYTYRVYVLTGILVVFKLFGILDWNWFWIISPFIFWEGLGFINGFLKSVSKNN
jgi:hypothetical protein